MAHTDFAGTVAARMKQLGYGQHAISKVLRPQHCSCSILCSQFHVFVSSWTCCSSQEHPGDRPSKDDQSANDCWSHQLWEVDPGPSLWWVVWLCACVPQTCARVELCPAQPTQGEEVPLLGRLPSSWVWPENCACDHFSEFVPGPALWGANVPSFQRWEHRFWMAPGLCSDRQGQRPLETAPWRGRRGHQTYEKQAVDFHLHRNHLGSAGNKSLRHMLEQVDSWWCHGAWRCSSLECPQPSIFITPRHQGAAGNGWVGCEGKAAAGQGCSIGRKIVVSWSCGCGWTQPWRLAVLERFWQVAALWAKATPVILVGQSYSQIQNVQCTSLHVYHLIHIFVQYVLMSIKKWCLPFAIHSCWPPPRIP